jgi:hypothetical protein
MSKYPSFAELTKVPGNGTTPGCAWIWGKEDNVGTLNFLTPDVVVAAKDEIKLGISCALNWEMTKNLRFPPHPRCDTTLTFQDASPTGTYAFDDEVS